jgi:hypothetical protein
MTGNFDLDLFDETPSLRKYLTESGRAELGLPEFVHQNQMPGPSSACLNELRSLLGDGFAFDTGKTVITPWLAVTKNYISAKTAYRAALEGVRLARSNGSEEAQTTAVQRETSAADTLARETRNAVDAVKVLMNFFDENQPKVDHQPQSG